MSKRHCILAATLLGTLSAPALADDEGLSDSQTSYTGAVMLEGELDVDFGDVVVGDMGLDEGQSQYAYFTGNTLYFGSEDDFAPPEQVKELEAKLQASGAPSVDIRIYDGAGHAFFNDENPFGTYDPDLATSTWQDTVAFLRDKVGG